MPQPICGGPRKNKSLHGFYRTNHIKLKNKILIHNNENESIKKTIIYPSSGRLDGDDLLHRRGEYGNRTHRWL